MSAGIRAFLISSAQRQCKIEGGPLICRPLLTSDLRWSMFDGRMRDSAGGNPLSASKD